MVQKGKQRPTAGAPTSRPRRVVSPPAAACRLQTVRLYAGNWAAVMSCRHAQRPLLPTWS
jgi:hypothetical protein